MPYIFTNANNTVAQRDDGAAIAWNATANLGPSDIGSRVYRRWVAEGSPIPAPYVAPPLTIEEIIHQTLLNSPARQNIVAAIQAADPATVDVAVTNYINNNVTDLASAKVMLIRLALLTVFVIRS